MKRAIIISVALLMLASCSQTKHLAEDEVLYKGIKEISYGQKARSVLKAQDIEEAENEGVIKAVGDAVNAIGALLGGKTDIQSALNDMEQQKRDKSLTKQQRDSIKDEMAVMNEAYEAAKTEVEAALACVPNGAIFGSSSMVSPWPISLHAYNSFIDAKTWFGKWIFNTFAREPVYISTVNPNTRTRVARNVLRNYGFFNGMVEYDILPLKDTMKAKVAYSVYPGRLYRLGKIEYLGFPIGIDTLIRRDMWASRLVTGKAFNVIDLDAERTRISELLRENGYYNFRPAHITYKADTIQQPGRVQLHVEPVAALPQEARRRYVMGKTDVTMLKYDDYQIVDSVIPRSKKTAGSWLKFRRQLSSATTLRFNKNLGSQKNTGDRQRFSEVTMRYSGKAGVQPLRLSELRKYMFYRKGDLYRHSLMSAVKDKMQQMGIFSQFTLDYRVRKADSLVVACDSDACDTLDVVLVAMLDKPYDSEFALNVVNKSNGQLGPGVSYSISKKNAFRRAETLKLKVYGSYEWQTGAQPSGGSKSALNSYELGGQLSLNYPRLILPNGRRLSRRAKTSTDFAVDISWMNRASYYGMAQFKGDMTYRYQGRRYISHSFTPVSLKFTSLLNRSEAFDGILSRSPALEVSMRDQFVPSMEYTLNMTSRVKAHHPRAFTMTFKQAGNLTSGIYAALGKSFNERNKQILGVPFAQFVKLMAEYKQEVRLTSKSSLVGRVAAGVVYSYGNSSSAPYSDLFCVGGANSIRAFCLRGVGPGSYNPAGSGFSYIDQMGDIKFEINAEYRFSIVGDLYGAAFVDAGNVWLMKPDPNRPGSGLSLGTFAKELALGTGAGLRYDLSFLVIRFDIGVGIHAPYDTGKKGYYNMLRFWDSLGFHFAVGYPF